MKIFDPKLTGSIEILNEITGDVTMSANLLVEGNLLGNITGSASTASYIELSNVDGSASLASRIFDNSSSIASLEAVSGSYANSSSFASNISANSASIASLETISGSYANSSSFASDISTNSSSIGSLNAVSSSYLLNTTDTLTGDLTVTGNIIATTLNVQDVTASVVYSSGSNVFGSSSIDTQQFTGSIKVSGSIELEDNVKLNIGNSNDLSIYHDGSSSFIKNSTGNLNIQEIAGGSIFFEKTDGENMAVFRTDAEVELYYNGVEKFATTSYGVQVTNLSNTTAVSETVDKIKLGSFGAGRPAMFFDTSNTTYTNRTWFIENIGSAGKFRIGRNGKDILEIFNDGDVYMSDNLSIGTPTADQTGYGYNTLTVMGGTTAGYGGVLELLAPSVDTEGQNYGIISFGAGGTRTAMISANRQSTNDAGNLRFWTSPNSGGIEERMRIDRAGNVGINVDPSTQIHNLQKTNDRAGGFYTQLNGNNYGLSMFVNSGGYGIIGSNGNFTTDVLTMDLNSGNVGIGGTPSNYKLEVQQTATTAALWVQTGGTTSSYTIADFRTGTNASALNIKGDGVVGIGTDFVSARLQVHSTNAGQPTIPLFIVNESTTIGTEARLGFAANTNTDVGTNRYSYISTINTSGSNGQAMIFATNATGAAAVERMRIDSSGNSTFTGNVNISSPGDLYINSGTSYNNIGSIFLSNQRSEISSVIVDGTANGDTALSFKTRKNGATATAMFINEFRNVMIGTTTQAPSAQLTIALDDSVGGRLSLSNLRTALFDGDEFGRLSFVSNDSTQTGDRARISALCRNTAAATDLVFYTGNTSASVAERMRITYNNLVCIGNEGSVASTTGWLFDASGGGGMSGDFAGNNEIFSFNQINSSTVTQLDFRNGNIERGRIEWTTSGTTYNTTSDYRLKENVEELKNSLTEINKLKPKEFNFISNPDEKRIGFIAHEVEEIVPQAVSGIKDDIREDGTPKYQALDHSMLVPLLVGAIQELKAEIEILKNK